MAALTFSLLACGAPAEEPQAVEEEQITDTEEIDIIDLANETCPVMGRSVMEGVYTDWEGYRIHFCCPGCDGTFLSDPEHYMGILAEDPSVTEDLSSYKE